MKKKIRVGILFGGRSAEHEVSLQSAKNIIDALDRNKFEPIPIGITKEGKWITFQDNSYLQNENNPETIQLSSSETHVTLTPWKSEKTLTQVFTSHPETLPLDVVFPVLHGPYGEDGTVQGLLKLANVPFVGSSVLGSAVGMDKEFMKRLLKDAGIPVANFFVYKEYQKSKISFEEITKKLGLPIFVKPANLGSSVGVNKAETENEFKNAVNEAFLYDRKILIEKFIKGREIECAVLGNEHPQASIAGEIIPKKSFYSYEAKYLDENGAELKIPANISQTELEKIQKLAIKAFQALDCEGMARVDFFLCDSGEIYVNELNTIPGFTKISMYPKLWEASGISYSELIEKLILLAIERFQKERKLRTEVRISS